MAATLLPTLSPPISRSTAAFLLRRRAAPKRFPCHPPDTLRRFLTSCSSSQTIHPPGVRPISTMPSTVAAARAVPARRDILMLGIETSCDDTAAAVVRGDGEILSQVVSSQADLLARYGGVAPKMAEEAHALAIDQVVQKALDDANLSGSDLSAVSVTIGPGLGLCLRVGVHKARKIAREFSLPIVGVHHMEAHALVSRLVNKELTFPFLALLISGLNKILKTVRPGSIHNGLEPASPECQLFGLGSTREVTMEPLAELVAENENILCVAGPDLPSLIIKPYHDMDLGQYVQLGTTIDDAIGEAYDKSARWLGLDMRKGGGPSLEGLALEGDPEAVKFRVPMRQHKDCNFSYAGLKTQVRLAIESRCTEDIPISSASEEDRQLRADIAASFQRVAVLHLEERCQRAVEWALKMQPSIKHFVVSGGVASNKYVRTRLSHIAEINGLQLVTPPPSLCTDNAVMIAWTGIEHFIAGRFDDPPAADEPDDMLYELRPRWPLGEEYSEGRSVARSMKTARIHPSLTSMIKGSFQK